MNTRTFLASLGALALTPWKAFAEKDKRVKLGPRLPGINYDNCIGKVAIDPRKSGERWVILDSLSNWVIWEGKEICNYRKNKWWVYDLDAPYRLTIGCVEYPEDFKNVEFYDKP